MVKRARQNYLVLILPLTAAFVLIGVFFLILSGFGISYAFKTPVPLEEVSPERYKGSYAFAAVNAVEGTFARFGPKSGQDAENPEFIERYLVYNFNDDKYIGVRVKESTYFDDIKKLEDAVAAFSKEEVRNMDLGRIAGTVSKMDESLYGYLCNWIDESVLSKQSGRGTSMTEADREAFYLEHAIPYVLNADFLGTRSDTTVYICTAFAGAFFLLALALAIISVLGFWDNQVRKLVKQNGEKAIADFEEGRSFTGNLHNLPRLHIGHEYIWIFKKMKTEVLKASDVIWAYPRSKRLEGGKTSWSIVMKTEDKREYISKLDGSETVQSAMDEIKRCGHTVMTGFDKEKQQLFDTNMKEFKASIAKNQGGAEEIAGDK